MVMFIIVLSLSAAWLSFSIMLGIKKLKTKSFIYILPAVLIGFPIIFWAMSFIVFIICFPIKWLYL